MRVTRTTPGGGDPVVVYEGEDVAAHVADAPARQKAARAEAAKVAAEAEAAKADRGAKRAVRRALKADAAEEEESDG